MPCSSHPAVINAEKAAYMAPAFQSRRKRTLRGIQQVIYDKFYAEAKKNTHQTVRSFFAVQPILSITFI